MRKVLLATLLSFVILIPTFTVEAAYVLVPNFRNMTSNRIEERIRYTGMEQKNHNDVHYTSWHYVCVDGKTGQYVNKYINKLNAKHNIQQVGHNGGDWYFRYSGNQAHMLKMFNGGFHIHVGVSGRNVVVNLVGGMYPE